MIATTRYQEIKRVGWFYEAFEIVLIECEEAGNVFSIILLCVVGHLAVRIKIVSLEPSF